MYCTICISVYIIFQIYPVFSRNQILLELENLPQKLIQFKPMKAKKKNKFYAFEIKLLSLVLVLCTHFLNQKCYIFSLFPLTFAQSSKRICSIFQNITCIMIIYYICHNVFRQIISSFQSIRQMFYLIFNFIKHLV